MFCLFALGRNDFAYPIYTSLTVNSRSINLTAIDNKFDFGIIQKNLIQSLICQR